MPAKAKPLKKVDPVVSEPRSEPENPQNLADRIRSFAIDLLHEQLEEEDRSTLVYQALVTLLHAQYFQLMQEVGLVGAYSRTMVITSLTLITAEQVEILREDGQSNPMIDSSWGLLSLRQRRALKAVFQSDTFKNFWRNF